MAETQAGMKCDVEVLTPTQRRFRVEVPEDRVAKVFSRVYRELGRRAAVRGFRAGRVPRHVLRGLYGAEVHAQALSEIVSAALDQALLEDRSDPVSEPRLEAGELNEAKPFEFSAVVEVKPDIVLGDYRAISLERPRVEVGDADVQRALESLRERSAQLEPVEGRERVEVGDYVFIDFEGTVEGASFPGGKAEGFPVEVGAGAAPSALERGLAGMALGVPGTIVDTIPEDSEDPDLAGRQVDFTVTVRDMRRKVLPPLDDDFARDHGACDSLEELREKVRAQLQREFEAFQDSRLQEQIVERLLEEHDVDAPPSMVERELSYLMRRAASQPESAPRDAPPPTTDERREEWTPKARRRVKAALLLGRIAETEAITASDAEVDARIDAMARASGDHASSVREQYREDRARAGLRSRIVSGKTLDFLLEQADVTQVEPAENG